MTTKPKPRKAPPKAHAGTPNDCGEISKLLARYRFLEADQKHNAAIAETVVLLVGVVVATDLFLAARSAHSDVISFGDARDRCKYAVAPPPPLNIVTRA